jgi:hypothetical protein
MHQNAAQKLSVLKIRHLEQQLIQSQHAYVMKVLSYKIQCVSEWQDAQSILHGVRKNFVALALGLANS